jgi:hypothetical protein
MTDQYPPGSTVPVQPWLIESIARGQRSTSVVDQTLARRDQYLIERFGPWRVYPVRVGRWVRKSWAEDFKKANDASIVLAPVVALWKPGRWEPAYQYVQLLDPASGQPIAEHVVSPLRDAEEYYRKQKSRTIAFIGDPRVCGLLAPVDAAGMEYVQRGSRRGADEQFRFSTPEQIEHAAAALVTRPYQDFADLDDGPWLAEHPAEPKGNTSFRNRTPWQPGS